jgi:hypothetical protein
MLYPVLVAGYGRSGTTAIMNLLATDHEVIMGREYPFETRYLSYFAKLASILGGRMPDDRFTDKNLYLFEDSLIGPSSWIGHSPIKDINWLEMFWDSFSRRVRMTNPNATLYAEKAPAWLPAATRSVMACSTLYLFRDPRDVYLSSNAFMKKRNYLSFHRLPGDTDLDHARSLAVELLNYFENFQQDKSRSDCFFLRYEDMISHPDRLLDWLRTNGLSPDPDRALEYQDNHSTSLNLTLSAERWRRETVPQGVIEFFERNLGTQMTEMGYFVERPDTGRGLQIQPEILARQVNHIHGKVELQEDEITVRLLGNDFGVILPIPSLRAEDVDEVWVAARGCVGDHFSVYWRDHDSSFSEERAVHVRYEPSQHWRIVRFRLSQNPMWQGAIHEIRLDLFNANGNENRGIGHVRWVRLIR